MNTLESPVCEKRKSQVTEQLEVCERLIMELNEGINYLEEMIEGVLTSSNSTCEEDKNKEARVLCNLAVVLKSHNDRIINANMRIRNIIQRCEL